MTEAYSHRSVMHTVLLPIATAVGDTIHRAISQHLRLRLPKDSLKEPPDPIPVVCRFALPLPTTTATSNAVDPGLNDVALQPDCHSESGHDESASGHTRQPATASL